jgi:ribonucleoside-triphosphate reductase
MLKRVVQYNKKWVREGHICGDNTNNVSATVFIKDEEWDEVGEFMWKNRDAYNGLAVLPYDCTKYSQPPFQETTEEDYEVRMKNLIEVDLTNLIEGEDATELSNELACSGGLCEV